MCNIFIAVLMLLNISSLISNENCKFVHLNYSDIVNNFVIQHNKNILLIFKKNNDLYLQQFDNCGLINKSYGEDGTLKIHVCKDFNISSLILKNNGYVLVGGSCDNKFLISKFNNSGNPDYTFGDNTYLAKSGAVISQIGNYSSVSAFTLTPDNKIIAAGISDNKIALASYTADGILDKSFANKGVELVSLGVNHVVNNINLTHDHKILVGATIDNKNVILRFKSNGNLDIVFSTNC